MLYLPPVESANSQQDSLINLLLCCPINARQCSCPANNVGSDEIAGFDGKIIESLKHGGRSSSFQAKP
ncbi:hypothetical protein TcWFU_002718 [Taenia crassiceps]|uniref:Uncharacterized protein n=1 Tax=Taenia crassiceps TaxID=6207 RepID=A0ABR4QQ19_9CEST